MQMVLPLVYDITNNTTQLAEKRDPAPQYPPTSLQHQAFKILKRYIVFIIFNITRHYLLFILFVFQTSRIQNTT